MINDEYKGKIVLAIGAHPDDIEFGCGATMAMLAKAGATLYFVVSTDGSRGSRQNQHEKEVLKKSRQEEGREAAKILGAQDIIFLDEEDGNLIADITFKEKVVKLIRQYKPDMVFTHDPSWIYRIEENGHTRVNHNDHRATGIAVLDAVYPLARDLSSFPEHMDEGITPHKVPEVYLFHVENHNFSFDVTGFVDSKIQGILAHKSQIDNPDDIKERIIKTLAENGGKAGVQAAENFTKLQFD